MRILFFILLTLAAKSYAQVDADRVEIQEIDQINQQVQNDLLKQFQKAQQIIDESAQLRRYIDQMDEAWAEMYAASNPEEMEQWSNEEYNDLVKKLKLEALHKKYEQFQFQQKPVSSIKVAILGNSTSLIEDNGFNEEVLAQLFKLIKAQEPQAVFFLGNLINGLHAQSSRENPAEPYVQLHAGMNMFGKAVTREAGYYDPQLIEKQLTAFSDSVKANLGTAIPFYPIPGEHEVLGPEALEIFQKHFSLDQAQILDSKEFVYSVTLGNTLFLAMSTDYYDTAKKEVVENALLPSLFTWLDTTLTNEKPLSRFRFVLGNDPAFSTEASFGIYSGLDQHRDERNKFWNLLLKHQVLAYFSTNEVLYDRSYRYGIWQFITGGAGAIRNFSDIDDTFYHYVLLTIPQVEGEDPTVEVYDVKGKKQDEMKLTRNPGMLFDLRIPSRVPEVIIKDDEALKALKNAR